MNSRTLKILTRNIFLMTTAILINSCGSNSSSNTSAAATFSSINGNCYSSTTGLVPSADCVGAPSYISEYNQCYTTVGVPVPATNCIPPTTTTIAVSCIGYYYLNNSLIYCNGYNCHNQTLISASSGQTVLCQ